MHHAKWLIGRILFLEGRPVMSKLNPIVVGKDVPEMLGSAEGEELKAVQAYNKAIVVAREVGDESTAHLLGKILRKEEGHMDWAERQRLQVQQLGVQNYLARQTKGATG